jgi:hypothetical protein
MNTFMRLKFLRILLPLAGGTVIALMTAGILRYVL